MVLQHDAPLKPPLPEKQGGNEGEKEREKGEKKKFVEHLVEKLSSQIGR